MLCARGLPGLSSPSKEAGATQRCRGSLSPHPALARGTAWKARLEWEKYQHLFIFSSTPTDHCILIRALLPFHLGARAGDNCGGPACAAQ